MTNAKTLAAAQSTPLFDRALINALPVEHLCDLSIDLELGQVISTPLGTRLTFVVKGGRFEGPRFRGEMLPGGGDWVSLGADGISRMDVRATMRTHDGVLIHYDSHGILRYPPDGRQRLAKGERISSTKAMCGQRPGSRRRTSAIRGFVEWSPLATASTVRDASIIGCLASSEPCTYLRRNARRSLAHGR
jgi:hypothetical protein